MPDPRLEKFMEELTELDRHDVEFVFRLKPLEVMIVVGNVQLGLRHPKNKGEAAKIANAFIEQAREAFNAWPTCQQVIDDGWTANLQGECNASTPD
jgi:hypothetical protein